MQQEVSDIIEEEFNDFVYIVSHDFSKPLRHVKQLCNLLFADMQEQLSEQQRHYLQAIDKSVTHGENMLDSLLEYSRLNTVQFQPIQVNCNQVMLQVQQRLAVLFEDENPDIRCEELPEVTGDETQLCQLFTHLIHNAILYKKPNERPRITVSVVPQERGYHFTIKDEGIGIFPDCEEKVFKPFRRLHANHVYPGVGMGLSVCEKIVRKHGGKMWCESVQHEFTQIHFTLFHHVGMENT